MDLLLIRHLFLIVASDSIGDWINVMGNNDTDILVKTLFWILQQKYNDIFNLQVNITTQNVKMQRWVTI